MKVDLTPYRRHIREELTPDKKERGKYACPICGSGTRSGGDGAFSIDKDETHGKCFACGFYGDIFDLYAARDGITLEDATREVITKYGKPDAAPAAYRLVGCGKLKRPMIGRAGHRLPLIVKAHDAEVPRPSL